jgi:hypothetical protein
MSLPDVVETIETETETEVGCLGLCCDDGQGWLYCVSNPLVCQETKKLWPHCRENVLLVLLSSWVGIVESGWLSVGILKGGHGPVEPVRDPSSPRVSQRSVLTHPASDAAGQAATLLTQCTQATRPEENQEWMR